MKFYKRAILTLIVLVIGGIADAQDNSGYVKEIKEWDSSRIKSLTAANGWINLVGLFWLKEGSNSFGSDEKNVIVFPAGTINKKAGYFELSGNTVRLFAENGAAIKANDTLVMEAIIVSPNGAWPTFFSHGDLRWTFIKRENKIGIRLHDLKSPLLKAFKGIKRFDVDSNWRLTATLQTNNEPANIFITNVLGQTTPQKSPGKLSFTLNGKPYTLDALEEDGELFVIFADASSGEITYPSGRFLLAKKPGADGKVILDFNKAYNPPCAFTKFATCPLPPRQNRLPFEVTAGEKYDETSH